MSVAAWIVTALALATYGVARAEDSDLRCHLSFTSKEWSALYSSAKGEGVVFCSDGATVLVDISVDQGGCFEDTRPTTHAEPTYKVHDSVFYCVANMPGAVPHTSTYALTNVTLPYAVEIADRGIRAAVESDPALALGVNTVAGQVTYAPVAEAHGLPAVPLAEVLA